MSGVEVAGLGVGGGRATGVLVYLGGGAVVVGIGARVRNDLILILRLAHVLLLIFERFVLEIVARCDGWVGMSPLIVYEGENRMFI